MDNLFYGQSGGVTPVINSTARGVIETARLNKKRIDKVLAGKNGILGLIQEELYNTNLESQHTIRNLDKMPGGVFGSCRFRLPPPDKNSPLYKRIIQVLTAHNIRYFLYNGGNDSADTIHKISQACQILNYPIYCIGIPKTIDNDLPITDCCPGYGSVAKYIATATREAGLDLIAMDTTIQVYILTVMGRDSGWIAAASGLAKEKPEDAPHIILCPEIPFNKKEFLLKVKESVKKYRRCFIVTANSLTDKNNTPVGIKSEPDAFGHYHYEMIAPLLCKMINKEFGFICHYSIANFLQRSARHLCSQVDLNQAYALGKAAVEFALQHKTDICPIIVRKSNKPYKWAIGETKLVNIAKKERMLPRKYLSKDGYQITKSFKEYLSPLIQGENIAQFKNGLPTYFYPKNILIRKQLKPFKKI